MKFFSVLGFFAFFGFLVSCSDEIGSLSEAKKKEIRTKLKQENFQGVILIAKGKDILFRETFYHKKGNQPNQLYRKHSFPLGEVTKPFTSFALRILLKEKKIKETDPVIKYLTWFPHKEITIENLLKHTSGLPRFIEIDSHFDSKTETQKRIQVRNSFVSSALLPSFPSGEYWKYTRLDYFILGYLIEILSEKSYSDYIKETILKPLNMNHSYIDTNDPFLGNSGIYSNPEDLVLWKEELLHPTLLAKKEVEKLFQKTVLQDSIAQDSIYFGEGMYVGEYFHWAYGKTKGIANLFYQDRKSDILISIVNPWGGTKGDLSSYKSILTESIFGGKRLKLREPIKNPNEVDLATLMKEGKVPAIGVAVYKNYKLAWKKNYGVRNIKTSIPVTDSTLFRAGSLSKTVTAVTAVKLAEEGKLNLYSNWNKKLRNYHISLKKKEKGAYVNLDSLLSHTSGLTEKGNWDAPVNQNKKHLTEIQDAFSEKPGHGLEIYYKPGSKSRYSGAGYSVIQETIVEATRLSFPKVITKYVGNPLGWKRSTFRQNLTEADDHCDGHDEKGEVLEEKKFVTPELAAGGLWTTPEEIGNIFAEVALAAHGGSSLISESSAKYLLTPKMSAANLTVHALVGRGFFINQSGASEYFFHGGHTKGHKSLAFFNANKGYGIVIMTNSENGSNLIWRILRVVSVQEKWDKFVN
ncbi:serine hydrolase domain-containing protein [Leptospira sp. 'Mane']|uniref:serine hydrolase domain-containing protein n=1 Tax=Leptospira sp. 'Mane' TaxID=3387407 RepID=UPI00398A58A5